MPSSTQCFLHFQPNLSSIPARVWVIPQAVRTQKNPTSWEAAGNADVPGLWHVRSCLRVLLLPVVDEVFLPSVALLTSLAATSDIAGKWGKIMSLLHVLSILSLRAEGLVRTLLCRTEFSEGVPSMEWASWVRTHRRNLVPAATRRENLAKLFLGLELVISSDVLE